MTTMMKLEAEELAKWRVEVFDEAGRLGIRPAERHGIYALFCIAEILCEIRDAIGKR